MIATAVCRTRTGIPVTSAVDSRATRSAIFYLPSSMRPRSRRIQTSCTKSPRANLGRCTPGYAEGHKKKPRGKPFEKGHDITRKGVGNKTTRHLKEAMLMAAEELGDLSGIKREALSKEGVEHGKDGLVGYLRWAGKCEPKSFMHILGKLIPVQMKVDSFTQTVYKSVEE